MHQVVSDLTSRQRVAQLRLVPHVDRASICTWDLGETTRKGGNGVSSFEKLH
jgi:hypothetical protein